MSTKKNNTTKIELKVSIGGHIFKMECQRAAPQGQVVTILIDRTDSGTLGKGERLLYQKTDSKVIKI